MVIIYQGSHAFRREVIVVPTDKPEFLPGRRPEQRPGATGSKRDRNRSERTQGLCEAALGLFLSTGLESVTIDDITRQAGVAKGSFYRYFDDKTQLVDALFAPLSAAIYGALSRASERLGAASTDAQLVEGYESLARDLVSVLLPEPDLVRLYLQECRGARHGPRAPIRTLSDGIAAHALELTRIAHASGLTRDLPPEVTACAVVGSSEALLFQHLEGPAFEDPPAAASALIVMVVEGLGRSHTTRRGL